jgi:hypothetical protein
MSPSALNIQKMHFKFDFLQFELCWLFVYSPSLTLNPLSSLGLGWRNFGPLVPRVSTSSGHLLNIHNASTTCALNLLGMKK